MGIYVSSVTWFGRFSHHQIFTATYMEKNSEVGPPTYVLLFTVIVTVKRRMVARTAETCSIWQLNILLTYSMVQSPSWKANWFAASQEIPRISRNPKVHYRAHKLPPPVSILRQPICPHPTFWRFVLILSTHLCLDLPSGSFPSVFYCLGSKKFLWILCKKTLFKKRVY